MKGYGTIYRMATYIYHVWFYKENFSHVLHLQCLQTEETGYCALRIRGIWFPMFIILSNRIQMRFWRCFSDIKPSCVSLSGKITFLFKSSTAHVLPICQYRRCRFTSWVGKIPWRRKWPPLRYSCLGIWIEEPGGLYSPWGHKRLGTRLNN